MAALRATLALGAALAAGALACQETEPEPSDQEVLARFTRLWFDRVGFFQDSRWLGVRTLQNPLDAWVTQEIIQEVEPDFIVETGTYWGGSALYWATVLAQVNPDGRVITIDVEDQVNRARRHPLWREHVDFLLGSSTDPEIVAEVSRRVAGRRVLVILDSLHTADHVHAELVAYGPLVGVGSYVVVQDTGWVEEFPDQSWTAAEGVRRFLEHDDTFEVDRPRERFMLTNNAGGYLKRVR
jgi:cephalosporin hydroxylase